MGDIIPLRKNPHEEVQVLLPWFVNGTLAPDEAKRVETHSARCADCRSDAFVERRLAEAVANHSPEWEGGWERMRELLRHERPARAPRLGRPVVSRLSWVAAAPFAAAAALALVFVNGTPQQPAGPQYRALSTAGGTAQPNLIVQFEPGTRVADIQRLLEFSNARLVDGPTVTGAYLLRVDQGKRELALRQLRDSRAISLAEPIDAPPAI